jgi:Arc/MetJ-type ribon-helix-helix transcriptional regulator
MTTISVPLPSDLLRQLEELIRQGKAPNKAAVMRIALEKYLEDQAVEAVLQAEREPTVFGDLDELSRKL